MGSLSMLRLFWRPSTLPALLTMAACAAAFAVADWMALQALGVQAAGRLPAERAAHLADLACLALPLVLGLLIGDATRDVRRRTFAFLLPGLSRRMLAGSTLVALAVASLAAWFHLEVAGTRPALAIAALSLLSFAYGAVLLDRPLPTWALWISWIAAFAATLRVGDLLELAGSHPIVALSLSVLLAASLLLGLHARALDRRLAALPAYLSILNAFVPSEQRRHRAQREGRHSNPELEIPKGPLGQDLRAWTRAVRLQSEGYLSRAGLLLQSMIWALVIPLAAAGIGIQDGLEMDGTLARGVEYALHSFLRPPVPPPFVNRPPYDQIALLCSIWFWMIATANAATRFRLRWLYPLARSQRATVLVRSLRQDTFGMGLLLALGLALVTGVLGWLAGGFPELGRPPAMLGELGLAVACMPLAQWVHLRFLGGSRDSPGRWGTLGWFAAFVLFVVFVALLRISTRPLLEPLAWPWQVLALAAGIAAGQAALARSVKRYMARADLP